MITTRYLLFLLQRKDPLACLDSEIKIVHFLLLIFSIGDGMVFSSDKYFDKSVL